MVFLIRFKETATFALSAPLPSLLGIKQANRSGTLSSKASAMSGLDSNSARDLLWWVSKEGNKQGQLSQEVHTKVWAKAKKLILEGI